MTDLFICDNFRTPFGSIGGFLSKLNPNVVGGFLIYHLLERNPGLTPEMIHQFLLGNTLSSNLGPDFATQVVRESKLDDHVSRTMINSGHITGLKLLDMARKSLNGTPGLVTLMGLENISSAPNYVANDLVKRVNDEVAKLPPLNGVLRDAYYVHDIDNFAGQLAEQVCLQHKVKRDQIDDYVLHSIDKAKAAYASGKLTTELCEVKFNIADGSNFTFTEDQEYQRYDKTKDIRALDPVFASDGRLTMASSARSADGGSVALVANEASLIEYNIAPKARLAGYAESYGKATDYVDLGAEAVKSALNQAGIKMADIDLIEIHEDFASTPIVLTKKLKADEAKVNRQGGSLSTGNPIAGTGLRLINSLTNQFAQNGAKYGLAVVCGPSGGSAATVLEKV